VTAAGFSIARRQVLLDQPIKSQGVFKTRVQLHPEVIVTVSINVAQSDEEAALQAAGKSPASASAAAAGAPPAADALIAPAPSGETSDSTAAKKSKKARAASKAKPAEESTE
ncbi:MAG TPA: 50S ribosomal L9 C-terminal domain-containing protein, partial [Alphaproteobacteria bacterium]|nr:50S ribosomal L9 C-terminal domain-containing protein [Alphaproteobacteria bacterium]